VDLPAKSIDLARLGVAPALTIIAVLVVVLYSGSVSWKQIEFVVKKLHGVSETFFSLVSSESADDVDLLLKVFIHVFCVGLYRIRCSYRLWHRRGLLFRTAKRMLFIFGKKCAHFIFVLKS